jgi:hypothetical protein
LNEHKKQTRSSGYSRAWICHLNRSMSSPQHMQALWVSGTPIARPIMPPAYADQCDPSAAGRLACHANADRMPLGVPIKRRPAAAIRQHWPNNLVPDLRLHIGKFVEDDPVEVGAT